MPKKFQGENSKSSVARARKEATKRAEQEKKEKEELDEFWKDDDKHVQRKQQRKEEREKKRLEVADRKAASKQLLEEEMSRLKSSAKSGESNNKVTRAQISTMQEREQLEKEKESVKVSTIPKEEPLQENINRMLVDGIEAHTIDDAISALSTKEEMVDKHPERRLKAAYAVFEEENLPRIKAENPNLRLSQLKQILRKDWMKSPQNPLVSSAGFSS